MLYRTGVMMGLLSLLLLLPFALPSPALSPPASPAWHLTTDELDASRQNHSRSATGIADLSSNNEVRLLLNGKDVMLSLLRDIRSMASGDSIHMTAFEVNGDTMLDPTCENPSSTKLSTVLVAAGKRNVTLRILVTDNLYLHSGILFCHTINSQGCVLKSKTCCAPDDRHNGLGGSIHSKQWTFVTANDVVSYTGSMVRVRVCDVE